MSTTTMPSLSATNPTSSKLEHYARWGLWALPVWTLLLFLGTLTHQPSYQTDFPAYARYVTTNEFLISHLVASILGAGIGILGFTALFIVLCKGRTALLALWALVTGVIGTTITTAVFGVAAFAQPAIGRAYLSGHMAAAVAINNDVYGTALNATALPGLLLLTIGMVLFGVAVIRSGSLPKLAGIGLVVGIVVFGPLGFFLADIVQSVGAALLVVSAVWIAIARWRMLRP
ncbi:MAG TPA: hypothetical protein VED37_08455 [Ktedonobacteraceae bacterium]|nr:hypothetical protein [Ktedonobacteraceae bacterium]